MSDPRDTSLMARVERQLLRDGRTLHRCTPASRLHGDLGDWYTMRGGAVVDRHVNLMRLATELGVLEADGAPARRVAL